MTPDVYWINGPTRGRLAILARPRGDDWLPDEAAGWKRTGISDVVSLLESVEAAELGLHGEAEACEAVGLNFATLPIPDRGTPTEPETFADAVAAMAGWVDSGRTVGVHCRQGIGRSAMVAAGVLVELGLTAQDAFARVAAARGRPVPETDAQRAWLELFARAREVVVR